jgi:endogenous inhibitor of DNA gyrase (YacG/DUF329 family)
VYQPKGENTATTPYYGRGDNTCPICQRPVQLEARPFCSQHCKDVDLVRWFNNAYCISAALPDKESPLLTNICKVVNDLDIEAFE